MGKDLPGQDAKIDLTKPFDPFAAAMQQKKKGNFEKTGDGKEKIVVGGKTYDCNWMSGKVVADAGGKKFESEIKVWLSKSVPLSGMVKMEMKSSFANVQMEIVESGSAK